MALLAGARRLYRRVPQALWQAHLAVAGQPTWLTHPEVADDLSLSLLFNWCQVEERVLQVTGACKVLESATSETTGASPGGVSSLLAGALR